MMQIENELKLIINESAYQDLSQNAILLGEPVKQRNYYFDTYNFVLSCNNTTLRLRTENDNLLILCLKIKDTSNISFSTAIEYESNLPYNALTIIKEQPSEIINFLSYEAQQYLNNLYPLVIMNLIGSIDNVRKDMEINNVKFVLDKTTYPNDIEVYEIEIEGLTNESQADQLTHFFELRGYKVNRTIKGKYSRFIEIILQ